MCAAVSGAGLQGYIEDLLLVAFAGLLAVIGIYGIFGGYAEDP
jgi:hypothetical protein